jgi:hypothetical protein
MKITTKIRVAKKADIKMHEDLGIPASDDLYNTEKEFIFDTADVGAITESMTDEDIDPSESVVYMKWGESFVIDIPFAELKAAYLK